MEALRSLYELGAVVADVCFQKIWMRSLPELCGVGGPAEGLVCIVTGPTSGIGRDTAAELARRGAHVILACRSIPRGEALRREIESSNTKSGQTKAKIEVMELDLNSLESVRRFAAAWSAKNLPLHILINNAGIFSMGAPRQETQDGFEAHLGTNHLGHFLLTMLLLPSLMAAADHNPGRQSRVVHVSSRLHRLGSIDRKDPHFKETRYSSLAAYGRSKLSQVLFSEELTRRSGGQVLSIALHPGNVSTDVVRTLPGLMQKAYKAFLNAILLTPAQGARCTIYCATSPNVKVALQHGDGCSTGGYMDSNCSVGSPHRACSDKEMAQWLWQWSAEQVGLTSEQNLPVIAAVNGTGKIDIGGGRKSGSPVKEEGKPQQRRRSARLSTPVKY